ncbi:SafA/ExsA family spore coat assembly protein [Virgibacillus sp. FSP13]
MKIHVVQKGDTLWELAKKYGVDFEELKQLNSQLSSPDMIMPGMKIKIPSSTKTVQKESMKMKETQQPQVNQPYKDISPKPVPVIKEDEKEKPKQMQPHMPKEQQMPMQPQIPKQPEMPQKPEMPMQPHTPTQPMQPMIQMPIMEQELQNYTTINMPQMPYYPEAKEEPVKQEKPKPMPQPQPQPLPQPMQMVPMCCHVIHPCGPPMPHDFFPVMGTFAGGHMQPNAAMHHGDNFHPYHHYENKMESPTMEIPTMKMPTLGMSTMEMPPKSTQAGDQDCGCHGKEPIPPYQMGYHQNQPPMYGGGFPSGYQHYPAFNPQQTQPEHLTNKQTYPPQFMPPTNKNPYPTPPGYPPFSEFDFRSEEDDSESE